MDNITPKSTKYQIFHFINLSILPKPASVGVTALCTLDSLTDRQTDTQTDRQTDRHTHTHTHTHTHVACMIAMHIHVRNIV